MLKRLTLLVFCLLLAGVSVVGAQDTTPPATPEVMTPDQACLQKGGNLTDGQCILSANLKMSVQYPLDLAQNDLVASTIDPFIQTTKNDFLSVLTQGFQPGSGGYELDINTDVVPYSSDVTSLVFSIYNYSGGAHGTSAYQTYTFDLAAGQLVTLEDLFQPNSGYLAVIDPLVEQALKTQVGDMIDPTWLQQGTGENPENYRHFALGADALTFYFDQYQVAPGAAGTQSVSIPLSALSDVLAPEYAP